MTKFEFIQEAALRLTSAWATTAASFKSEDVATEAKNIADAVWEYEMEDLLVPKHELERMGITEEPEPLTAFPKDENVSVIAKEIAKLEREKIRALEDEYKKKGYTWHFQISGANVRFQNVCNCEEIKTVADLIACGRVSFRRKKNMGEKTVMFVDKALENLYNIKSW